MRNVDEILKELTLYEKAALLAGHKSWHTNKISRVDLPSIFITDGPHGLRKKREDSTEIGLGQTELSTAFPTAATSGSSWNKELLYEMGEAMGKECNYYGVHVLLGPAVNIKRNPLCGRSFEYFSEDPLISGVMGARLTSGIEARGVGTSVKHYACNNNENNRYFGDSIVDTRAFREIYLKGFERIVKEGKPQTLMCAYNKVRGEYASENRELLTDIPRGEWGFEGVIMSDWGAVNDRVKGLNAGLDLEMPGDIGHNRQQIVDAVKDGRVSEETLDASVRRVLNMIYSTVTNKKECEEAPFDKNSALSKRASLESAVLLRNDNNILPLSESGKYLCVGEMFEKMRYQGAGSSLLNPYKLVSPLDAFLENGVSFEYKKGYDANEFTDNEALIDEALKSAENAETIIFFGGLSEDAESESFDRDDMLLPKNQTNLLSKLIALGKKTVFVMYGGSPVELDAADGASAILNMYLPGQEGGASTYELLFGKACPSGRLCESWPYKYSDVPFSGEFTKTTNDVYKESIFVGYRYYSTFGVEVRYPFGFGLSYASFSYKNMSVKREGEDFTVRVSVKNESDIAASEVVQLYVRAPKSELVKPLRELRAFTKLHLLPHEEKEAVLCVPVSDLRYFVDGEWQLENGVYTFEIARDVNTVILEDSAEITDGCELKSDEYYKELYSSKDSILGISDADFEKIIGKEITLKQSARPYDLNTPMRDFKTLGGKFILGVISLGVKMMLKKLSLEKDSPDKRTKIKNLIFGHKCVMAMSLRALSFSSEGSLSYRMAMGLLDIANNRPLRGIFKLIVPEKCFKLPK